MTLINLREKSKLSQTQMADFLDVNQITIAEIEKEAGEIRSDWLGALMDLYTNGAVELEEPESVTGADLKQIADVNRIVSNMRFMHRKEQEI